MLKPKDKRTNYKTSIKVPSESQRMAQDTNSKRPPVTLGTPEAVVAPKWPEHSQTIAYAVCS